MRNRQVNNVQQGYEKARFRLKPSTLFHSIAAHLQRAYETSILRNCGRGDFLCAVNLI